MTLYSISAILSHINYHFAQFICRIARNHSQELAIAAALVSYWTERGHICIDLNELSQMPVHDCLEIPHHEKDPVVFPSVEYWIQKLLESGVVGKPGEKVPLILDSRNRLYLYRYHQYETNLLTQLIDRSQSDVSGLYLCGLSQFMDHLFEKDEIQSPQRRAVEIAIKKKLCIVSGGPGTGKTTVAAKIIAALIHVSEKQPKIHLTAPTGKAAQRLQESLNHVRQELNCSPEILAAMPQEAMTIHRLLGPIHRSPYFKHNADNPLESDVVIVDEASMIDLALMSKLLDALRNDSRLIILGDKDQLASVEPGSVLGDICHQPNEHSTLKTCTVHLSKNYRFGDSSGIYAAAMAVNQGNSDKALEIIDNVNKYTDITWKNVLNISNIKADLNNIISHQIKYLKFDNNPRRALMALSHFRILCAVRKGPYGVEHMNGYVTDILALKGWIQPNKRWYHGRPVMITKNDPTIGLYNGDIGLILKDREDHHVLKAFFTGPDNGIRKYLPARLPEHETVFAMTVHKSQGSEFDYVLLVLPDKRSKVLTRELVYTGITRTRKGIDIWGSRDIFADAVKNKIYRQSGLADAWNRL